MKKFEKVKGTLTELIEGEHARTLVAAKKYGHNLIHTLEVLNFLEEFFVELNSSTDIFLRFYYSMRNFYLLCFFSTIRLHHVQAMLDLRQLIESGINAAYAIAFPTVEGFSGIDEFGLLDDSQDLTKSRNKWFDEHYTRTSKTIRRIKRQIQRSAHSTLTDTHRIYKAITSEETSRIEVSFFDRDDEYLTKAALWQLANTTLAIVGLCFEVSRDYKGLTIVDNFPEKHTVLMRENLAIREGFMRSERFKKADRIAKLKEKKRKELQRNN